MLVLMYFRLEVVIFCGDYHASDFGSLKMLGAILLNLSFFSFLFVPPHKLLC